MSKRWHLIERPQRRRRQGVVVYECAALPHKEIRGLGDVAIANALQFARRDCEKVLSFYHPRNHIRLKFAM
jgi:hypothetical protein